MNENKILFSKVCIVGVGLIGGSIGMGIKKKKLARLVVGVVRRKATIREAFQKKAVDVATLDLKGGVKGADLVILCAPVSVIASQLKMIAPHLKKGAVVMDVGSSKALIEKEAKKYLKKNLFVGCHPMAGSEATGVQNASADLFEKSVCFLTKQNPGIFKLWRSLGSTPVLMSAEAHDAWAAKASHLPHVLAFSLFQDFKALSSKIPLNPSLQEFKRLAKSNPELWADILLSNKKNVTALIQKTQQHLTSFHKTLTSNDRLRLIRLIRNASQNTP